MDQPQRTVGVAFERREGDARVGDRRRQVGERVRRRRVIDDLNCRPTGEAQKQPVGADTVGGRRCRAGDGLGVDHFGREIERGFALDAVGDGDQLRVVAFVSAR